MHMHGYSCTSVRAKTKTFSCNSPVVNLALLDVSLRKGVDLALFNRTDLNSFINNNLQMMVFAAVIVLTFNVSVSAAFRLYFHRT